MKRKISGAAGWPSRRTLRIRAMCCQSDRPWSRPYDRDRDLPRLLPLSAEEIATPTAEAQTRLVALLRRALRAERVRAREGHWTYDPARHAALLRAFRIEADAASPR